MINDNTPQGGCNSFDSVTYIVLTREELAGLPAGALIVRKDGDTSHLPANLQGRIIYVEGVEDHTRRPMSASCKQKIEDYWRRLGRDQPPPYPKQVG